MNTTRTMLPVVAALLTGSLAAQLGPEVTSWRTNLNGATGSSTDPTIHAGVRNLPADVQSVQYNPTDVYVRVTAVPSHSVGPFGRNPNQVQNTNAVFRITRNPRAATNPTATSLGPIGVFLNGVPAFNALDGRSYFNQGIWNQNAYESELRTFDAALGHPSRTTYHYHVIPLGVLEQEGETWGRKHSPLIGYAFDGYPIYGPYGYTATNGTGAITLMTSSYRLRTFTTRAQGPAVSTLYPRGFFVEDYEYIAGHGTLDEHNGRFCVTPEYPNGTYCYFATMDATRKPIYPFLVGPRYYGVAVPNRRVTIPPGVTTYEEQTQRTGAGCDDVLLDASGLPTVPNASFAVTLANATPNGVGLFVIGQGLLPISATLFGCPIYVDLSGPTWTVGLVRLNASGEFSLPLPIPNNSALVGNSADLQAATSKPGGTTTSNALTLLLK